MHKFIVLFTTIFATIAVPAGAQETDISSTHEMVTVMRAANDALFAKMSAVANLTETTTELRAAEEALSEPLAQATSKQEQLEALQSVAAANPDLDFTAQLEALETELSALNATVEPLQTAFDTATEIRQAALTAANQARSEYNLALGAEVQLTRVPMVAMVATITELQEELAAFQAAVCDGHKYEHEHQVFYEDLCHTTQ
ncbi:MAG: chromosome segregation ATPase [Patiriisocius sp.]|jgi:chromosome segregation ATPase